MLQVDYVEKLYVKLLTVISIKAVKCILPLLLDSPSYILKWTEVRRFTLVHIREEMSVRLEFKCCSLEVRKTKNMTGYIIQIHTQNYVMIKHSLKYSDHPCK